VREQNERERRGGIHLALVERQRERVARLLGRDANGQCPDGVRRRLDGHRFIDQPSELLGRHVRHHVSRTLAHVRPAGNDIHTARVQRRGTTSKPACRK
jgi:hypothetical protein